MSLIEMEHHNPPGGFCKPPSLSRLARRNHNRRAVDHNSDDSGFPTIAQGGH